MLTGYCGSSLVVDLLCDQARGHDSAVTCFYLDFAARKEQSATNMQGSLLKQMVSGREKVPGRYRGPFKSKRRLLVGAHRNSEIW